MTECRRGCAVLAGVTSLRDVRPPRAVEAWLAGWRQAWLVFGGATPLVLATLVLRTVPLAWRDSTRAAPR